MLQDDVQVYLDSYVQYLVNVDDIRSWRDLTDKMKLEIYEKVIRKFSDDYRFNAFILLDDFLVSVLYRTNAYDDLWERILDLCHCPVSQLIAKHVKELENEKSPNKSESDLDKSIFNGDIIKHINEMLPC